MVPGGFNNPDTGPVYENIQEAVDAIGPTGTVTMWVMGDHHRDPKFTWKDTRWTRAEVQRLILGIRAWERGEVKCERA